MLRMALLHRAEISPSKLELVAAWLPGRSWFGGGPVDGLMRVAAYRFDDPAGEVGIETLLVRAGDGPICQVPLTYRGAPLDGGDAFLIGTTEHSVLGRRWVYDGCGDPVYAAALASAILTGSGQADEFFEVDGQRERREPSMSVAVDGAVRSAGPAVGSIRQVTEGDPTTVATDTVELSVFRDLGSGTRAGGGLVGAWSGQPAPVTLAQVSLR
jgi:hypothetical protein